MLARVLAHRAGQDKAKQFGRQGAGREPALEDPGVAMLDHQAQAPERAVGSILGVPGPRRQRQGVGVQKAADVAAERVGARQTLAPALDPAGELVDAREAVKALAGKLIEEPAPDDRGLRPGDQHDVEDPPGGGDLEEGVAVEDEAAERRNSGRLVTVAATDQARDLQPMADRARHVAAYTESIGNVDVIEPAARIVLDPAQPAAEPAGPDRERLMTAEAHGDRSRSSQHEGA